MGGFLQKKPSRPSTGDIYFLLDRLTSQFLPEIGEWLPLLEVLTTEGFAIRWSERAHSLSLAGCRAVCVWNSLSVLFTADLKRTISAWVYRPGWSNHCHRLSRLHRNICYQFYLSKTLWWRAYGVSANRMALFDLCDKTLCCVKFGYIAHKLSRIPCWRDPHWLRTRKSFSCCLHSKRGCTQAKCCLSESAQQSPFDKQDWQQMF